MTRAVKEVSHYLGNTPAVCRASYIDPRVIDAYNGGLIIRGVLEEIADTDEVGELPIHQPVVEQAVLDLLNERETLRPGARARGGLIGASSRRSAGPPVTPWTTIETITQAIAVHTTSSLLAPDSTPAPTTAAA